MLRPKQGFRVCALPVGRIQHELELPLDDFRKTIADDQPYFSEHRLLLTLSQI